jgi:hypothetical protein
MARCSDCNKFVSNGEPELQNCEIEVDGGIIKAVVDISIPCADCGSDLKTGSIEGETEMDGEHDCPKHPSLIPDKPPVKAAEVEEPEQYDITENCDDPELGEDFRGKGRGQKHFYNFDANVKVQCRFCEEILDVNITGETQASWLDDA